MLKIIWSIGQPSLVQSHAYELDLLYLPIPQTQVQKNSKIFELIMTS